ncbi:MAG: hypothetical protein JO212_07190 [Acetobacteraceae bacterium]|nr:hypothetical protein [Acetobacteraceae bacterium]
MSTVEASEDRCRASSRAEWMEILTSSLSSGLPPQARDRAAAVKRDCRARRSSQFVAPADLLCHPCSAALRFGVRATLAFDNERRVPLARISIPVEDLNGNRRSTR